MNRMDTDSTARQFPVAQPTLTVKMGDKQWVVGAHPASNELASPLEHVEQPTTSVQADKSETSSPQRKGQWREQLGAKVAQSVEDLLEPVAPTEQTVKTGRPTRRKSSGWFIPATQRTRWKDTFQFGCILGLLLGCLSMVLFHQMAPDMGSAEVALGSSNTTQVLNASSNSYVVPAVKVQILQSVAYSSRRAADGEAVALRRHGVEAVVQGSGSNYVLWTGVALRAGHLQDEVAELKRYGVSVSPVTLTLSAQQRSALAGSNPASLSQVSHWLSSAASALASLTAVEADGGVPQDASTAYQTAKSLQPSQDILAETGQGELLHAFSQTLDSAFSALVKHQNASARGFTLQAYQLLSELHS
ncbi:hypothetical protein [Alicyclobacillus pomorum]|jgi:hypothetical protein|uniref:hypothetical protein n=1 Tax=Alicyclobacillus pomorum TaxID=204470 RepID=UPI0004258986|nr:hypothetical protein [Alicyclobacillus pomorum]